MENRRRQGKEYEDLAAAHLETLGYVILERGLRLGPKEIDLIAEDGETLVFVEVRGRRTDTFVSPLESVTAAKRRHLVEAAEIYYQRRGLSEQACRFDVVSVVMPRGGPARIEHYPGAFMAGE